MKTLKPYDGDSFEFYKEVIKRKNITKDDPLYKTRVSSLNKNLKTLYKNYDRLFDSNSLQQLVKHGYITSNKDDLHKLYKYRSSIFQELKIKLTTAEKNRIISTCQNCTIGEVNSFDHVVPKEEFAEFVVNPKNLFPSCTTCNGHKSTVWRNGDKRIFLNLYLDSLPEQQYLFVKISIKEGVIEAKFFLDNRNGIDSDLFELISNHYNKLHLCRRFSEHIDSVVTPLLNTIASSRGLLTNDEVVKLVLETNLKNKEAFGYNYWKSILEIALISDKIFVSSFL